MSSGERSLTSIKRRGFGTSKDGKRHELTTRYEVQSKGILKIQPNYQYNYLEGQELQNFVLAVNEYHERVARQLYNRDPKTGQLV